MSYAIEITRRLALAITVAVGGASAMSNVGHAAKNQVDYLKHIKPVLAKRCYACHGSLKQESDLRLDTAALAIKGGASGPAIVPGKSEESLLIQRVSAADEAERMPPEGEPLEPEQIAVLREWITQSAHAPADERPEQDAHEHWAFRPIVRPPVPEVSDADWVRNPIDAFVAQQHEQSGLTAQAEAPREVLVRRLWLDLIGLPPTPEERASLSSDDWYERSVDLLLADPRHGERWARHWMDIWRYSDWWGLGEQLRFSHPHIWHWRDWIVESLNANTPYDEMVRLMLAADELYPNDLDKLRATGYLVRNYFLFNRNQWLDETVEHVSKGFLGLTMNCTKCHDHKYDPIAQADYYRLRAFFEPYHVRTDVIPGEANLTRDSIPRAFDGQLDVPTYRFERGQESQPDKSAAIAPGVPELLSFGELTVQPVSLPKEAWQPARRTGVLESYIEAAQRKVTEAETALATAREKVASAQQQVNEASGSNAPDPASTEALQTALADAQAEERLKELAVQAAQAELASVERRGAAMQAAWMKAESQPDGADLAEAADAAAREAVQAERQAAVAKAFLNVVQHERRLQVAEEKEKESLEKELKAARETLTQAEKLASEAAASNEYTPLVGAKWVATRFLSSGRDDPLVEFPPQSTGRRTALAKWITDPQNPLTARVAVNHIWLRHMSTPLVPTVFDFGRNGSPPTHPELLDWLASELIDSGWDMKHLHHLIVTSSVYRMSSSAAGCDRHHAKDPENHHLWRRTPIRLESQIVRDSILSLAGTLDLTRGGPPVPPADQADSTRRSLYFFHSNNEQNPFLAMFDEAPVKECYRRDQSIVPQQALALTNSRLVRDAAQRVAERLSEPTTTSNGAPDDREFVEKAFVEMLAIRPNDAEIQASLAALDEWRAMAKDKSEDAIDPARTYLIWTLFNHNDFITLR